MERKLKSPRYAEVSKERQGTTISGPALLTQLKQCGKRKDLQGGKLLHSKAKEAGYHNNRFVTAALVTMYSKCGSMQDAHQVFKSMPQHDVVSWTALILGYVENGESLVALNVFNSMDCAPDSVTFVAALKACAALATNDNINKKACLQKGMTIHRQARERGFERDLFVANILIDMYSKCGKMQSAREVFDRITPRDAVSWNALILGYVENGESLVALDVFHSMDCAPNSITFLAGLKACVRLAAGDKKTCLQKGVVIHQQAKELGFDKDVFVANVLVNMYSKCGEMVQARDVFDRMQHRGAVVWNTLILGYVENGMSLMALNVFNTMNCAPDGVTFVAALKACAGLKCVEKGMAIHRQARERGFDKDEFVASTLVDMYSKCGEMVHAREVFDGMLYKSVVCWNALMLGYVENGESLVAMELFNSMDCVPDRVTFLAAFKACASLVDNKKLDRNTCLQKGVVIHRQATEHGLDRDLTVANTLIDMYSKLGNMLHAYEVFDRITHRSVVSWNVLILGYVENGLSSAALNAFNSMDCAPDSVTFVAALKACASLGELETGQRIHDRVCDLGFEQDIMVANSLVDFYGKCGNMAAAEEVFNRMHYRDIVSWTALIGGYSLLGNTTEVFSLVKRMEEGGLQMNAVTLLLILTACSHAGKVEEAECYFKSMSKYGISPTVEHYTCMVDVLGKANKLQEALSLLKGMPFEADTHIWMTLLGACRKWSNLEIGEVAFHALVTQNDQEDVAAAFVFMQNIYVRLGMLQEGEQLTERKSMLRENQGKEIK